MTTLTFPSSPNSGDKYNAPNGVVYTYTDGKWVGSTSGSSSLPTQSGNTGKYLTTNGSITSWTTVSASPSGSNTQIQFNDNGSFGGNGNLTFNKTTGQVHIGATTSSAITDGYNGALVLEGGIGAKGNIHMLHGIVHNQLYVGNNAGLTSFVNPTLIIKDTGVNYLQAAVINANSNASADWVAYGDNGDDTLAWADMGFAGSTFNDANYTITKPNDGYFFVQGGQDNTGWIGGNLVLATGASGAGHDIIFATGGFLSANEVFRISNANKALEFTGSAKITTNGNTWTFDNNGNLTLPANTFAINYANGQQVPLSGGGGTSLPSDAAGYLHNNGSGTLSWNTNTVNAGSPSYSGVWILSSRPNSAWSSYSLTGTIKQIFTQGGSANDLTVGSQTVYGSQLNSGDKIAVINDSAIHTNSYYGILIEFPSSPNLGDTFAVPIVCPTVLVNAGSFVVGKEYTIVNQGSTTNWSAIGATSTYPGSTFTATGVGSGDGTATTVIGVTKLIFKPASGQRAIISNQGGMGATSLTIGTGGSGIAAYIDLVSGFGGQPITWVYAGVISSVPTWYQMFF